MDSLAQSSLLQIKIEVQLKASPFKFDFRAKDQDK